MAAAASAEMAQGFMEKGKTAATHRERRARTLPRRATAGYKGARF